MMIGQFFDHDIGKTPEAEGKFSLFHFKIIGGPPWPSD